MDTEGLNVGLEEFKRMKSIDRDVLIYKNVIANRQIKHNSRLHYKVQYCWLFGLTMALVGRQFIPF